MRARAAAVAVTTLAVVAACQQPSTTRTQAQLVGDTMLAGVGKVVKAQTVRGRGPGDPERPFRRATVLHDARVSCTDDGAPDASCGAVVEIFRKARGAAERTRTLDGDGLVVRRGTYVLRVSPDLDRDAARDYRSAFLETMRARGEG